MTNPPGTDSIVPHGTIRPFKREEDDTVEMKKRGQYDWYVLEVESDSTFGNPHELVYDCVVEAMQVNTNIENI